MTEIYSSLTSIFRRHSPLFRLGIAILFLYLGGIAIFLWSVNFWCRIKEVHSYDSITITQQAWHVEKRGFYTILPNYVRAELASRFEKTVTFATASTYPDFRHLSEVCGRWKGPISAAVYAPGSDFQTTMKAIFRLRLLAENTCIRQNVTFHLYYESDLGPSADEVRPPEAEADLLNIESSSTFDSKNSFKSHIRLPFPANVGRNVALEHSKTKYVLSADLHLYPSAHIPNRFLQMAQLHTNNQDQTVYVLPVYKITSRAEKPPDYKSELVQLSVNGKAVIPVGLGDCNDCHVFPKANGWLDNNIPNNTIDTYSVVRKGKNFKSWQPYFISTKSIPKFDEKVTKEGRQDRFSQAMELCLQQYEFHILDNAFLVLVNDKDDDVIQDDTIMLTLINQNNEARKKTLETMVCYYGSDVNC